MTETTPEIRFREDSDVSLVNCEATDLMVVQAAKVSTVGADSLGTQQSAGLIDYLMRSRHGSPFESSYFRFLIRTPIFVAREFMRHRMASYSERSGRYTEMVGEFYIPGEDRPLGQVGKPSQYNTVRLADADNLMVRLVLEQSSTEAWKDYIALIDMGVSREVARMVLPVNSFTEFYVSMNARGLMNFLSLRVKSESAAYETNPMHEIQQVAVAMENLFAEQMPLTYGSFVTHGRVAP